MLIVIDCDKTFSAVDRIVEPVVKEIMRARSRYEWIMFVETDARTVTRITKHVRGYHKVLKVRKDYDDGSPLIFERIFAHYWLRSRRLKDKHVGSIRSVRVVGLNTSACIIKTVYGLRRFVRVTVVSNAVANSEGMRGAELTIEQHHRGALRRMKTWKNVRVV